MNPIMPEEARLIWAPEAEINQCVVFRRDLVLTEVAASLELLIAADTDFIAWLNGVEIGRGQYPDFPDRKTFSTLSLAGAQAGRNQLTVLAYHGGEDFFSAISTPPGLIAAVFAHGRQLLVSDRSWKCRPHRGWRSGRLPFRTIQTGFTSEFDARLFPADWMTPGFDDRDWPAAVENDLWRPERERPLPACRLKAPVWGEAVKSGTFRRHSEESGSVAEAMAASDYFFSAHTPESRGEDDGVFLICDCGEELAGLICFELSAPAGSIVDYAHGEHLDDGIVRMRINERNFADRYICREGLNRHELCFHRVGARYVQVNVTPSGDGPVQIQAVGIRPWSYPLPPAAEFHSDDLQAKALRRVATRTLELCIHDHYEDCPWREQALFSYDARNQALYGYYLWGNDSFARASFQLLADSYDLRNDHLMMMCAPMRHERTIPIFSFLWVAAAWENYLYSGDKSLFTGSRERVADMVRHALAQFDPVTGLYHTGTAPELWNFYECTPGLDLYGCGEDEFHAGYNLYLLEMLTLYAKLLDDAPEAVQLSACAEKLRAAVNAAFWNEERQAYCGRLISGRQLPEFHDHIQYLALTNQVPSPARAKQVVATICRGELQFAVLNALPYLVHALMPFSAAARRHVAATIRRVYGQMLDRGATTFWETQKGAADFANAGSLCHAWSSLPVYYQSAFLLGVRPLAPGFKRFEVRPYADEFTHCASGEVPTPCGAIHVHWQKRPEGLHLSVTHPPQLECVIADYPECPVCRQEVSVQIQ